MQTTTCRCEYCGTPIPADIIWQAKEQNLRQLVMRDSNTSDKEMPFNIVVLLVLMFLFWPAAIFYLIISSLSAKQQQTTLLEVIQEKYRNHG